MSSQQCFWTNIYLHKDMHKTHTHTLHQQHINRGLEVRQQNRTVQILKLIYYTSLSQNSLLLFMVNIQPFIQRTNEFFDSSFLIKLEIYSLLCAPQRRKISFSQKYLFLFFCFPRGENSILHLPFSLVLTVIWMNGCRGKGTPEHTGTMMNTGKRLMCIGS